jgi:large subunit ribosomal protein L54
LIIISYFSSWQSGFIVYLCSGNFNPRIAMSWTRGLRHGAVPRHAAQLVESRGLAIASKARKGGKGGADAAKTPALTKEIKSTTVYGANILKEGSDPKIQPDSEYPDWLWQLLDKRPVLSELRRKDPKTLPYEDLKRFVKLDNRARIKENNALTAKN